MLSPILLFVYNRLEHTKQLISSLLDNSLAKESELFIYADGARNTEDEKGVKEVRSYIQTIRGFKKVTIIEQNENKGLARSIIDGVTEQVNHFGKVIVLEDDLVVAPYFLTFMNQALELYQDEPRVGHIQACDFTNSTELPHTFLIRWTGSWGWATWKDSWALFNPNGQELLHELKKRRLNKIFDFNGAYPFTKMLHKQVNGGNDSWAIRWNATLFLNNILSLNVGRSLVSNKGFDGSGTHCGGGDLYGSRLWMTDLPLEKIDPIKENLEARVIFQKYYKQTQGFWAKVRRRIKRTLKGDFKA